MRIRFSFGFVLFLSILFLPILVGCGAGRDAPRPEEAYFTPAYAVGGNIAQTARTQIGRRYKYGGSSPGEGFDCSGLVHWTYLQHGVKLPRTTAALFRAGSRVELHELQAGDLVFFRSGKGLHAGIYTGDGMFVHSPKTGGRVSEASFQNVYWRQAFVGGRRIVL